MPAASPSAAVNATIHRCRRSTLIISNTLSSVDEPPRGRTCSWTLLRFIEEFRLVRVAGSGGVLWGMVVTFGGWSSRRRGRAASFVGGGVRS